VIPRPTLDTQFVSAGRLIGGLLLAGACALPGAGRQTTGPTAGQSWRATLADGTALDLVWIPPGTFTMGSPAGERGRRPEEGPPTRVTLTTGFWLGKTPVTIGQWRNVMGVGVRGQLRKAISDDTLYDLGGRQQTLRDFMHWSRDVDPVAYLGNEDDNLPVYFVSWNDAMEFARKLTARERAAGRLPAGNACTLPTEAQWEYACRAGTTSPTYAGPDDAAVLDKIAWYDHHRAMSTSAGPSVILNRARVKPAGRSPMPGVCMTCMATSGNGVGIGTGPIPAAASPIPRDRRMALPG
jgi:formylglycine-generating enzyme required for sulfatase activity